MTEDEERATAEAHVQDLMQRIQPPFQEFAARLTANKDTGLVTIVVDGRGATVVLSEATPRELSLAAVSLLTRVGMDYRSRDANVPAEVDDFAVGVSLTVRTYSHLTSMPANDVVH